MSYYNLLYFGVTITVRYSLLYCHVSITKGAIENSLLHIKVFVSIVFIKNLQLQKIPT
ncbi:hypothetical protein VP496E541_P0081 [Vibrio phage 496E54-1]|nr:hypothetical protein VP495E541_P0080 [Vibrio phage 495E54-1]CAH9013286.1 hypothetical protein VP496E541_P0081 [Vibrio phage 496E54-1]